jgi:hypothetical protein
MGKFFEYPPPSGLAEGEERIVIEKGGITYSAELAYISLESLGDVDTTGIIDGSVLKWDNTGQMWVIGTDSVINELGNIGDVTLTTPSNGQVLEYQSGEWVNATLATGATFTDKVLTLNDIGSPDDTNASGGGIVLKGATDKSILWTKYTPSTNDAWVILDEGLNVVGTGNRFKMQDDSFRTGVQMQSFPSGGWFGMNDYGSGLVHELRTDTHSSFNRQLGYNLGIGASTPPTHTLTVFGDINVSGGGFYLDGNPFSSGVPRSVSNIVATGGEGGIFAQPATTTDIDNVDVWVNGIKLVRTTEFTSDGTNITITNPTIVASDDIEIITWE